MRNFSRAAAFMPSCLRRTYGNNMIILKIFALILMLVMLWFFIERNITLLTRKKIAPQGMPRALKGMKLCHISDTHLVRSGRAVTPILEAVAREKPDIILLTGDLISRITVNFALADRLLCGLAAYAPVYFSLGNHECDLLPARRRQLDAICAKAGIHLLDNALAEISFNGERFIIAGFTAPIECYHDGDFGGFRHLPPCKAEYLAEALGKKDGFTLLLAHNPLFFDAYAEWGAELILSGHVHGGIIRLPFLGGILSPERKFFPKYYSGEYFLDQSVIYVSRGLGKLRLFNPREVVFLTLI